MSEAPLELQQRRDFYRQGTVDGHATSCGCDWTLIRALSPLLAVYVCVTLLTWPGELVSDEGRYLQFAANLCQGRYALVGGEFLWNGPGYPLLLAAIGACGLPMQWARASGAGFLYLAVVFFGHFMALYVPRRWAVGAAWALGLYYPMYLGLGKLMTENLAVCLLCGSLYTAAVALRTGSRRATVAAGVLLGWLALTKVFFGYVLLGGLVGYVVLAVVFRRRRHLRRMAMVYLIGLLVTVPYLSYTYRVTGRVFYWSNCGGLSLYWMSTPHSDEFGDWFHPADVYEKPQLARHRPLFDSIAERTPLEKDAALRRAAVANIRAHPRKFARNVVANMARMWFSFPYSYTPQKLTTLFYVLPGALLLSGLALSGVVLWMRRPPGIGDCHLVLVPMCLTLGGSALLSAYPRMLEPIVPCCLFFVGLAAFAVLGRPDEQAGRRRLGPK